MSQTMRVERGKPATLTFTFYNNEVLADPDDNAVSVSAVKADGTVHTAPVSASRQSTGTYIHQMSGQTDLNHLKFTAAGHMSGLDVEQYQKVEVVGGFYFSIAELRASNTELRKQIDGTYKYSYADLVYWRSFVEDEFEKVCHRAFVPRFAREFHRIKHDTQRLWLKKPEVREVTKLVVDGTDYTTAWVTAGDVTVDEDNPYEIYLTENYFPYDTRVEIEYEIGPDFPPLRIVDAAKQRARGLAIGKDSRIDERATRVDIQGFGTVSLARPGVGKYRTGIPTIDEILDQEHFDSPGGVY